MDLEDILPGCKIQVVELEKMSQKDATSHAYPSALYSVLDDHSFEMTVPSVKAKLVPLPAGTEYYFLFSTTNGLVRARGMVEQRYQKGNFYLQKVTIKGELSKYQRREYFRIDCMFPLIYISMKEEQGQLPNVEAAEASIALDSKIEHFQGMGTAIDISGGGIRFTSSINLEDIPYVLVKFKLDLSTGNRDFSAIARIVMSNHIEGTEKYSHRVQFVQMDESERELIIRYIFETERKRRQKA